MKTPIKAALFDLDDTLAESFQPASAEIIALLDSLLAKMPVALVTGAGWPRIQDEFLVPLAKSEHLERFYILPNSSAECYIYENGTWKKEYDLALTESERSQIKVAMKEAAEEVAINDPRFEPLIIDRGVQVAYAAIGLEASLEDKKTWDPDQNKRKRLKAALERRLPDLEVRIGGMTSIDVTQKDLSKAYGVEWLSKRLGIPASDMIFVGDALYPGGNDEVVIPTGIQTRATSGPTETEKIIEEILYSY